MKLRTHHHCSGTTLIELVVAIVVIAIAITGVLNILSQVSSRSADAMIRAQATYIADAYLNEVLQKSFTDPDGISEVGRANYDDINDYNALVDVGAHDQSGAAIAGLDQFTVSVAVGPGVLGAVPAAQVRLVNVTVQHSNGVKVMLSGYRTQYP